MLSRDEYRQIKSMSKDEMNKWLSYHNNMINNSIRKEYNNAYKIELDNSIQNFIIAISYALHFNEELHLQRDEMVSFMEDLFVTVDLFRTGEYNPEDYKTQLEEDGIKIEKYDYDKLYRECRDKAKQEMLPYKKRNEKAIKHIENFIDNSNQTSCNIGDLQEIIDILEGDL